MSVKRNTQDRKPDELPISAYSSTLMEKPKRGRPTIPDNQLLGARNQWASLLEESWPEIGWPLVLIRKQLTSTIEDVRKAFQPVKEKPHNSGLANAFYRETVEIATPAEVRKNRVRVGELQAEIHHGEARLNDIQRSIWDVEGALKIAPLEERNAVQEEIARRGQALLQLQGQINQLKIESDGLDKKSLAQEAYVYASELLNFLHSGRRAVNPKNVANALAGLPMMGWRQSHLRCSQMPSEQPRLHYKVLEVILKMWKRRRGESKESLTEFFETRLPKLPKKLGYTRDFLLENRRDLRLAIEECLSREHEDDETAYVLASIFMRNTRRQKNSFEQMLADQEKLKT
jgi:hypothetical protein